MPQTPEGKVKARVRAKLKEIGSYWFTPATGGYGKSGVPDIVACINGKFVGIECKAGDNKPTILQEKNLAEIRANGGIALVIHENNLDELDYYFKSLSQLLKDKKAREGQ